ncbi:MAG: DndE family protein [Candidatus Heimdallarchaeota archaeon]|nr:DndE family protein [Candidatus Heimdallarchaeota archaeon]MCK4610752.1 DndE family protein [Candidatus Heimdallarchaeota archaeon]
MKNRLKTSKQTEDILNELEYKFNLPRNIILRYAISLSLVDDKSEIKIQSNSSGLELTRSTLTGEFDSIFKGIISIKKEKQIDDDEFFEDMKFHADRGTILLKNLYDFEGNIEKAIIRLSSMND